MAAALVTVIIPTYNRVEMLKQALDSVLMQDYPDLEIIVSDNASTDGTCLMMKKYCENFPNIIYIQREENIGSAKNGCLAYQRASGKYFIILCDDDLLAGSSFFSKAVKAMEENPNIAFTRGLTVTLKNGADARYYIGTHSTCSLIKGIDFYLNYERPGYEHVDSFFGLCRKQWADASKIMSLPRHGLDRWLWAVLPLYGDVHFIPEVIGYYREHEGARDSTSAEFAMQFREVYNDVSEISRLAIEIYPDRKEEILARRNPEVEAVWVMKFYLDIIRPFKNDKDLLKLISPLKNYPILYNELLTIINLRPNLKFFLGRFINRVLKKIGIKLVRV